MEEEYFLSGYCRVLDGSRMVTVETDGNKIQDIDCCYGACGYESMCKVGQRIKELQSLQSE